MVGGTWSDGLSSFRGRSRGGLTFLGGVGSGRVGDFTMEPFALAFVSVSSARLVGSASFGKARTRHRVGRSWEGTGEESRRRDDVAHERVSKSWIHAFLSIILDYPPWFPLFFSSSLSEFVRWLSLCVETVEDDTSFSFAFPFPTFPSLASRLRIQRVKESRPRFDVKGPRI